MSYQQEIAAILEKALTGPMGQEAGAFGDIASFVEVPKKKDMGDFAFPCFRLAKVLRNKPPAIAAEMLPHVEAAVAESESIGSVKQLGPYLNFFVNKAALAASLIPSVLDGSFLARREDRGEKVMIEYSQPNTHKAFHVGHTRNVALGDALWRIYDWAGYETVPVNYIGDEGAHIAKCLWYYRTYFEGETPDTNLGAFLGDLYTQAVLKLDFSLLTQCPMPGVVTARVLEKKDFPGSDKLKILSIDDGEGTHQAICGGVDYAVGDMVAYARVGSRVKGRVIETIEKEGVSSTGMALSELELGLSDEKEIIYTFPADTMPGVEVAEYFRTDALDSDVSVLEEMRRREQGVADTLHGLEAREPELYALFEKTKQWSMDEFHAIYNWLDARFDHYFFESEVGDTGKKICMDFYDKGVLVKSEGAIGADLSEYNLPFLLLIKSNGAGLYATKDISLARDKFEQFGVDRSIYVVDASQSDHFKQVFKTLELMGYDRAKHCYHLAYGLVMLPGGEKMGSRKGNVILFNDLKTKLDERIRANFLDQYKGDWPDAEIDEASRRISVATIKYGMTNQDNMKVIEFDIDKWTSQSGNTGPYMLYAYARTRNILRKAGEWDQGLADWGLLNHEKEEALLNLLSKFPEVAQRAAAEYRPQVICLYLYELTRDFSRFYDNCPVLKAESEALKVSRLMLVDAAGRLIQKGLELLGIQTLDRM